MNLVEDELAITDLIVHYLDEEVKGIETIDIDPYPGLAGDQRHIWFYSNKNLTWQDKLGTFEMIGYFNTDGRFVELTTFTTLPWEQRHAFTYPIGKFDLSNPDESLLRAELRAAVERARTFLRKRTTHGK